MASSLLPSSNTLRESSSVAPDDQVESTVGPVLRLDDFPEIFVLPTHLSLNELHNIEDQLVDHGAKLTYDINEARIVLGKVGTKKRAQLELRSRKLWTEEVQVSDRLVVNIPADHAINSEPLSKRRRIVSTADIVDVASDHGGDTTDSDEEVGEGMTGSSITPERRNGRSIDQATATIVIHDSSTESEDDGDESKTRNGTRGVKRKLPTPEVPLSSNRIDSVFSGSAVLDTVKVLKLEWLSDSLNVGAPQSFEAYLVYEGIRTTRPVIPVPATPPPPEHTVLSPKIRISSPSNDGTSIIQRAKADVTATVQGPSSFLPAPYGARRFKDHQFKQPDLQVKEKTARRGELLQQTTSEYEGAPDSDIPPPPDWVKRHVKYACQRVTLANPPNDPFIEQLKKIRTARLLTADEIGVRAYSTSIAAVAAYPYKLSSAKEILSIPGCDIKIANLWIEWKNTGTIRAAEEAESDESLTILRDFYEIWGVGATTAREFYYDKGWRDRDDIVEYGWSTLSRVQQIGVKYYDEFLDGIPRDEVESIAAVVKRHAVKVRDTGIEVLVVGGYRRGKERSGDVDMIVSHRDLHATAGLVTDIVSSLETEGWITHTLLLALTNTERQQSTLPFKALGVASRGAGFDTLDKALVVWQDPRYDETKFKKNPNIHRRVDIIISPWRTVGCAVTGWSGGTTFQRDLRRYSRYVKGWKFDSSGIRDKRTGNVVHVEGPDGVDGSIVDAERRVFEGLGLVYREPWERCTG